MAVFMINYQLVNQDVRKKQIDEALVKCSDGTWCSFLPSSMLIRTSLSASQISTRLKPVLHASDRFMIIACGKEFFAYLDKQDQIAFLKNLLGSTST